MTNRVESLDIRARDGEDAALRDEELAELRLLSEWSRLAESTPPITARLSSKSQNVFGFAMYYTPAPPPAVVIASLETPWLGQVPDARYLG